MHEPYEIMAEIRTIAGNRLTDREIYELLTVSQPSLEGRTLMALWIVGERETVRQIVRDAAASAAEKRS